MSTIFYVNYYNIKCIGPIHVTSSHHRSCLRHFESQFPLCYKCSARFRRRARSWTHRPFKTLAYGLRLQCGRRFCPHSANTNIVWKFRLIAPSCDSTSLSPPYTHALLPGSFLFSKTTVQNASCFKSYKETQAGAGAQAHVWKRPHNP